MLERSMFDISGWVIGATGWFVGVLSFVYAVHVQHRNELAAQEASAQINDFKNRLEGSQKSKAEFARTVHDLCFQGLLHTKNYPSDLQGLMLQRETLNSTITAIQRVAQDFSERLVFQGQFVWGSELGTLEGSVDITTVWLVSRDLLPDAEEYEILTIVASNAARGKCYKYVFPDAVAEAVSVEMLRQLDGLIKAAQPPGAASAKVEGLRVPFSQNQRLFCGGSLALYECRGDSPRFGASAPVVAFEEVLIPNERRGSLWRRQDDVRATSLLQYLRELERSIHQETREVK